MPWEKPVGFVIKSFLSAAQSQPFFYLGGEVLEEPRFHVLVPWQPALFEAGNHPSPSVCAEVNLGGVAAEFDSDVCSRIAETYKGQ